VTSNVLYMTNSIAVLEDSYSKVIVNVIDLVLNYIAALLRCRETTKLVNVSVCISRFV